MKRSLKVLSSPVMISAMMTLGCSADAQNNTPDVVGQVYNTIYWSDGDSGRLDGLKFRLANIDAPETGRLGQRSGAKCELEIERGFEAKAYIVDFTRDAELEIINEYGQDRYGRLVIDLAADGKDVAQAGVKAGVLGDWPHKNGRALQKKPNWCIEAK